MKAINTYLNFNGNTEEAFNFYKSVFGGEFLTLQRFKDTPGCGEMPVADQDKIMHVALPVGGNILMGTDVMPPMPAVTYGTGISICIDAESEAEAQHLFGGLAAGGRVEMPLEKMFWGTLFGMITDKFDVQWMINYEYDRK